MTATNHTAAQALGSDDRPAARPHPAQTGLVLLADGVGGLDLCHLAFRHVIRKSRLPYRYQMIPWGHGKGRWFADLSDTANRDEHGRLTADAVRQFRAENPGSPVFLVGKSAGSGVVIKALERLDEATVDRAILLAPALSFRYDLSRALHAVRSELVVFWSPLDVVILGAGTRVFGTADRVKTISSGLVGFRIPAGDDLPAADRAAYDRLHQIRWRPAMAATGHFGGHFGPDSPLFLKKYVLPLLTVEALPLL